jgi:hypothetical protein
MRGVMIDPAKTAIIVVDPQNDFVAAGASMETPAARALTPKLSEALKTCHNAALRVIYTAHVHMRTSATIVCALIMFTSHQAHATLFTPADFGELVNSARSIAHGQIVAVRARATDDRVRIETLVTLRVATYLKGDLGPEVTFVVPGGTLGRYRSFIVAAPRFVEREEVVLFLGAQAGAMPYVLRLAQGVFRVAPDKNTGQRLVTPWPMLTPSDEWRPVVRGMAANRQMTLSEFGRRVRELLERGR